MNLRARLQRLERRQGPAPDLPTIVCLDLPDGKPDKALIRGQWQPVPDGRALLRELEARGVPVKVYGLDPDNV
jgi:hypothetical protein